MGNFFKPCPIGNLLPQVHWHIMARFETDSYFPEPMWGQKTKRGTVRFTQF
jgi:diadenosine tetraphosphate (Ap4A) HIT family hydrolase